MAEDWLKKTLQRADGGLGGESARIDPQGIRARVARQRRRGRIVQVAVLVAVGGVMTFFAVRAPKRDSEPMVILDTGAVSKPAAAGLELSVGERIALETQIRLDHRRNATRAQAVGAIDLAEQRDQAARIMVFAARQRAEAAGPKDAADLYQRTIALFPETSSAGTARVALAQLTPNH